ncbi:ATPase, T2SS/T4P/T4SS family [Microbispora sp. NPDC046973]|uniref:ATPase, T2SS/T4P/T4SS family n=1 Tax=Microbispora sp. NPDC046973 TaxID=3155022 RepID=UPI003409CE0A
MICSASPATAPPRRPSSCSGCAPECARPRRRFSSSRPGSSGKRATNSVINGKSRQASYDFRLNGLCRVGIIDRRLSRRGRPGGPAVPIVIPVLVAGAYRWRQECFAGNGEPHAAICRRRRPHSAAGAVITKRREGGALIADTAVQNIDINGCREVWVTYADGRKVRGPAVAGSDEELIQRIRMWGVHGGQTSREFSTVTPMLNAALKERVRLSAVMAITPRLHVSIRCHRHVDVTLADLVELGTLEAGLASFLATAVRARKDILVTGGVNAGKTTMLRALAAEIGGGIGYRHPRSAGCCLSTPPWSVPTGRPSSAPTARRSALPHYAPWPILG